MEWFWIYTIVGISITLGGCYCCASGCSHCSDVTEDSTVQVDFGGMVGDADTAGCCTALNRSYILTRSISDPCNYAIIYENGDCATSNCDACDATDCAIGCDELPETRACDPALPSGEGCSGTGDVTYGSSCDTCYATEGSVINYSAGADQPQVCTCTCVATGLFWDIDVPIANHPYATWAVAGAEVYWCNCVAKDCTARVGKSSATIAVVFSEVSGDTVVTIGGTILSRVFAGETTITGNPIVCATEINSLPLTIGATGSGDDIEVGGCGAATCLCTIPTSCDLTFIA